jgi:hypothetical protein
MRARRAIVLAVAALGCCWALSCSKESPTSPGKKEKTEGATVAGTLQLPAEAPGKTFAVVIDDDTNSANGFVKVITGTCGSGTRISYQITEVPAGTYYLYAVVWVVSSPLTTPRSGDFVGFYGVQAGIPSAPNATVPTSGRVTFDIQLIVMP